MEDDPRYATKEEQTETIRILTELDKLRELEKLRPHEPLTELEQLRRRVAVLEEALQFYADLDNYRHILLDEKVVGLSAPDDGEVARYALEGGASHD